MSGSSRAWTSFDHARAVVVFDGVRILTSLTSSGVVMTPVPATEALVDWAVEWIGSRSVRVADIGAGSGAVAVAVALRAPGARIWATDDSEAAVALARANVARHGLEERVEVLLGELLEPVPGEPTSLSRTCRTTLRRCLEAPWKAPAAISRRMRSMHRATDSVITATSSRRAGCAST